ncbi:MAG: uroporphyrinogen decarboxylase family protein [Candidatus Latescibacter sp.]|nr:uroporphyrinogen decarboxylase family protein [Candidatus Latescibacter sp.]
MPLTDPDKSDINRLLTALCHREPDRLPHLELWVTSKPVYEFVLGRRLEYDVEDARVGGISVAPEDHVEFAGRLGMDAVLCNFSWRPNNIFKKASDGTEHYVDGSVKTRADLDNLEPPIPLRDQFRYLERYLRAAENTGIGVVANFTSFFDSAMLAAGVNDSFLLFYDDRPFLEDIMDIILEHQEKVMNGVCAGFGNQIAFFMVNDDIGYNDGLMINPDMFMEIFPNRMRRLIAPARDMGKLLLMHTDGKMDRIMPILHEVGFDAVHPIEPESNDIFQVKKRWAGRMALIGNIPTVLLAYGHKEEIEERVREYCVNLAPGGGYVLGSSTSIMDGIPPENFTAMTEAVHKYGRYGSLGIKEITV